MSITTGVWPGAGTTANVSFIMYRVEGNSGTISMSNHPNSGSNPIFGRGTEHNITVILKKDIGEIYSLCVWHDNAGNNPSWYLEELTITDVYSGSCWKFVFQTWLSLEDESSSNEVLQNPSSSGPNIISTSLKEMFSNGHLWLSVITKTPGDCFTRVQRISSCFCLLFCTMAVNAAFYHWGAKSYQTINLGPLKFSARQAIVSIQCTLITLPLHVTILLIKKSSARVQGEHSRLWLFVFYTTCVLCAMLTVSSAAVTVSYSLLWGSEKSQEWISSVTISFFQDILIVQPFKCLLLVSLTVMFTKYKAKKAIAHRQSNSEMPPKTATVLSMTTTDLSKMREESAAKARHRLSIRQAGFYLTFLLAIGVLSYENRDSARYLLFKSLDDHVGNFKTVRSSNF